MKSLEELKRENERLKSIAEVNRDFVARNKERRRLIEENRKLKYSKVYNIFCVCCDYEKTTEIKISKDDYNTSLIVKELIAKNTKLLTTDKSYNQSYKNIVVKN